MLRRSLRGLLRRPLPPTPTRSAPPTSTVYCIPLARPFSTAPFLCPCPSCGGLGLVKRSPRAKTSTFPCAACGASGLLPNSSPPPPPPGAPRTLIVGAGLAGLSLSLALSHRGLPHALFDADPSPEHRRQGYSLTLQHGRAAAQLGLELPRIASTRHLVLDARGGEVASWGRELWGAGGRRSRKAERGHHNFHISRSLLRDELLGARPAGAGPVSWGKRLAGVSAPGPGPVTATFEDGSSATGDVLVAADGVHSFARGSLFPSPPPRPSNVTVSLGIFAPPPAPLPLDFATVVQIADGEGGRLYLQPFDRERYMWQFSHLDGPWSGRREPADILSRTRRLAGRWASGAVGELLSLTPPELVSSYSIVDRDLPRNFRGGGHPRVTFVGDAAHPMT